MSVTSESDLVIYHVLRYTFVEREISASADYAVMLLTTLTVDLRCPSPTPLSGGWEAKPLLLSRLIQRSPSSIPLAMSPTFLSKKVNKQTNERWAFWRTRDHNINDTSTRTLSDSFSLTAQMERICQRGSGFTIRSLCCTFSCEAASQHAVSFSTQIQGALSWAAFFFVCRNDAF